MPTLHLKTGSNFCKLDISWNLHKDVMAKSVCQLCGAWNLTNHLPERNEVILICKGHHPLAILLRYRKKMLQYIANPPAEF